MLICLLLFIVCSQFCDELYEPVCGSDNKTYDNECELKRQKCKHGPSSDLKVVYPGKCIGKSQKWKMSY